MPTTLEPKSLTGDTRFLDPRVIARISNLELVARFIVQGFLIGLHKSPYHGFSSEFSSYRKYSKGDSFKFIDWKVAARTDRIYIKQFEENTNTRCHILLDASGFDDLRRRGRAAGGQVGGDPEVDLRPQPCGGAGVSDDPSRRRSGVGDLPRCGGGSHPGGGEQPSSAPDQHPLCRSANPAREPTPKRVSNASPNAFQNAD